MCVSGKGTVHVGAVAIHAAGDVAFTHRDAVTGLANIF